MLHDIQYFFIVIEALFSRMWLSAFCWGVDRYIRSCYDLQFVVRAFAPHPTPPHPIIPAVTAAAFPTCRKIDSSRQGGEYCKCQRCAVSTVGWHEEDSAAVVIFQPRRTGYQAGAKERTSRRREGCFELVAYLGAVASRPAPSLLRHPHQRWAKVRCVMYLLFFLS